ncbi:MAG: hypothetical protein NT076_01310 [Candidatus Pacearchaeota archaeon]|nr:hypothetical protein [Candidatus Pacearchaeota archaeon]
MGLLSWKCKDCGKEFGLFNKKIKYQDFKTKKDYYVCIDCYESKRKKKEGKIAQDLMKSFLKAKHYAINNRVSITEAYKKLKLGDYKKKQNDAKS